MLITDLIFDFVCRTRYFLALMNDKSIQAFRYSKSIHKWIAIVLAIPLIIIFSTGILLISASKIQWLQPSPVIKKTAEAKEGIVLSFDRILEIAKTVPEAEIRSWNDVTQIDARPKASVVRVRAKNFWEVQIDGNTGEIVSSAKRWKTFFVLVHEGSWFANWVKTWIFLPSGIGALLLWISGLLIWLIPFFRKRGKL